MEFTAKQIAQVINGRIEGNENATINSFAKIRKESKVLSHLYQIQNMYIIYILLNQALFF